MSSYRQEAQETKATFEQALIFTINKDVRSDLMEAINRLSKYDNISEEVLNKQILKEPKIIVKKDKTRYNTRICKICGGIRQFKPTERQIEINKSKEAAIKEVQTGKTVYLVCKEMNLSRTVLYRWIWELTNIKKYCVCVKEENE